MTPRQAALEMRVTPEMLAAAWKAFQKGRQGVPFYIGSIGPGPGFKEAIEAAFDALPIPNEPASPAPSEDVMGLLEAYENLVWQADFYLTTPGARKARAALIAAIADLQRKAGA